MKLGLIIKNTNGGEAEGFSINTKDDWTRYASDARSAIKELDSFDESGKVVYLVRFLGSLGYLFCVIKARPQDSGRANDNTAAWIHVPSKVKISAEDMEKILKEVEKVISGELGMDEDKLKEVFGKDYPEKKDILYTAVESIESAKEGSYALRYYNGTYQLYELIGDSLSQKEYGKYRGLFLVDEKLEIKLIQGPTLDLEPKKLVTIPPVKEQFGFTPYFRSQKFDRDIEVFDRSEVKIEWRKERYAPIEKSYSVGEDDISKLDIKKPDDIKWRIRRSEIIVKTDKGETIDDATIYIGGRKFEKNFEEVSEDDLKKGLKVKVSAEGYNNAEELYNERGVIVTLSRKTYHKVLEIDVDNASNGVLSFDSFSEDISKSSPVKGYEVVKNGKKERLQYNGNGGKANDIMTKFFSLGFASCFALILLLFGGWHFFKEDTPKREGKVVMAKERDKDSSKTVNDTVAQATPTQEELKKKMKDYLSQPMTKDSCKKLDYEELWTALSTYNVEKVENYVKEFPKLQEVVEKLRECDGAGKLKKLKGKTYAEAKSTKEIYLPDYVSFLETRLHDGNDDDINSPSGNSTSTEEEPNSGTEQGGDNKGRPKN